MSNSNNITPESTRYLFEKRLFIGFIKFYNEKQGFGYLVSSDYGFNDTKKGEHEFRELYIDKASFDENVNEKKLVVFRPAVVNKRLKATNIVQYRRDIHSSIAIDYILESNIIHFIRKRNITVKAGRSGVRYEQCSYPLDISIYSMSNICRYKIINKCSENYKNKGRETLLRNIDNYIIAVGGDEEYFKKLNTNYPVKEKEHDAIKGLISSIDKLTCSLLISNHGSFQFFVPINLQKELIDVLNYEYPISEAIMPEYSEKKLKRIINDKEVFSCFCNAESKKHKTAEKNSFLRLIENCTDEKRDELWHEIIIQINHGIQEFMAALSEKSLLERKQFLTYCNDFINDRQKETIMKSINDEEDMLRKNGFMLL